MGCVELAFARKRDVISCEEGERWERFRFIDSVGTVRRFPCNYSVFSIANDVRSLLTGSEVEES